MRTVIISHNNDPMYSFFEPIIKWAWGKFEWDCKCYVTKTAQEAQFIRMFAHKYFDDKELLMTSDIDMLPLSNYWQPKHFGVTCYGRDLSLEHQPICYVAMSAGKWRTIVGSNPWKAIDIAGSRWLADQDFLTCRLEILDKKNIYRGVDTKTGYPVGRIDRSAWDKSLLQQERIDAHLPRPGYTVENWARIMSLIKECLNPSSSEISWLHNYRNNFVLNLKKDIKIHG